MKRRGRPPEFSESFPVRRAAWDRKSESNVECRLIPEIPLSLLGSRKLYRHCAASMAAGSCRRACSFDLDACLLAIPCACDAPRLQGRILDSLSAGLGKLVDKFDETRHGVVGHAVAAKLDEIFGAKFRAGRQHDRDLDFILPEFRRHRIGRRLQDCGMLIDDGLDLPGGNVLAAAPDRRLLASAEIIETVLVGPGEIARMKPSVAVCLRGRIGKLVIMT